MKIKTRHFIRKDEKEDLKKKLSEKFSAEVVEQIIPKESKVEIIINDEEDTLYAVNNKLKLWESKKHGIIPVLTLLLDNRIGLKNIIVDEGAIRFVTNGADIMRPGITKIDPDIKKGDIIRVADEDHDRTLAIGKAMYDAFEMEKKDSGKVVENVHTIKDDIWEFEKNFR
ncbi:MAG: PUA domain containing protein [Promethearchaeota archaeon]|nr:MAG: PUA domain containing protein [Candidatus Lokiarchaeota archaeon]